jgi:hypothetical protein
MESQTNTFKNPLLFKQPNQELAQLCLIIEQILIKLMQMLILP